MTLSYYIPWPRVLEIGEVFPNDIELTKTQLEAVEH